jgi:hypothetical protein
MGAAAWAGPAYYAAAALAARAALAALGAGGALLWRPEVSTPLNSLLGVREGLRMLRLGLSPYAGAACHAPPLVLALHAATAARPALYVLPNILADAVAAGALAALAVRLCRGRSAADAGGSARRASATGTGAGRAPWLQQQAAAGGSHSPFACPPARP